MIDGDLRKLFSKNLPDAMWVPIESGMTGAGIPDAHFVFPYRIMGWIEFKKTEANAVGLSPFQVGWHTRYVRYGGRSFIGVRQRDKLFLFVGGDAAKLKLQGLAGATPLGVWTGGPSKWNWKAIQKLLCA